MEKKRNSFLDSFFTLVILFLVLLSLFLCLGMFNEIDFEGSEIVENNEKSSEIEVDVEKDSCILCETQDMGQDYIDKLVFLGESTTYGLWRYGILTDGQNTTQVWTGAHCVDGSIRCAGTLSLSPAIAETKIFFPDDGSASTISEAVSRKCPEYLVITLGLNNGASYYSEDQFKQCYRILLNSVLAASTDVKIILQSLFPVSQTCKVKAYTPERISLCNSWIQDIATEYEIKYLDTTSVLSDPQGYLMPEYDNGGDGIHLNATGLSAVVQYIRTHGYPEEAI